MCAKEQPMKQTTRRCAKDRRTPQLKRSALARTGRNRHGGARSDLQVGRLLRRIVLLVCPELLLPRAAGGLASLPRVPCLPGEVDRVARARVFCELQGRLRRMAPRSLYIQG